MILLSWLLQYNPSNQLILTNSSCLALKYPTGAHVLKTSILCCLYYIRWYKYVYLYKKQYYLFFIVTISAYTHTGNAWSSACFTFLPTLYYVTDTWRNLIVWAYNFPLKITNHFWIVFCFDLFLAWKPTDLKYMFFFSNILLNATNKSQQPSLTLWFSICFCRAEAYKPYGWSQHLRDWSK